MWSLHIKQIDCSFFCPKWKNPPNKIDYTEHHCTPFHRARTSLGFASASSNCYHVHCVPTGSSRLNTETVQVHIYSYRIQYKTTLYMIKVALGLLWNRFAHIDWLQLISITEGLGGSSLHFCRSDCKSTQRENYAYFFVAWNKEKSYLDNVFNIPQINMVYTVLSHTCSHLL